MENEFENVNKEDKVKKETIKMVESELENSIIRIANSPEKFSQEEMHYIKNNFAKLRLFAEENLTYMTPDRIGILNKVNEISEYFENITSSRIKKSRLEEKDAYINSNMVGMRSIPNKLEEYKPEELFQGVRHEMGNFAANSNAIALEEENKIRNRTLGETEDLLRNQMFQEIRSSIQYREFANKEEFLMGLRSYISGHMLNDMQQNFMQISQLSDNDKQKIMGEVLFEVSQKSYKFINSELGKDKEKDKEEEKKELGDPFRDSLESMKNSEEEIAKKDATSQEKDKTEEKDRPVELKIDLW